MSTLKVNGLTYRTVEREVERLFDKYGKINEVFIPKDRYSRRSRGFAFVRFVDKGDAENAMDDLDRRLFDGRELRIEWSKKDASGERRRSVSRTRRKGGSRSRSRERRRRRSRSRSKRRSKSRSRSRRKSRSRSRSERRSRSRSRDRDEKRRRKRSEEDVKSDSRRERRGSGESSSSRRRSRERGSPRRN